jgi:hypothetical protein
MSLRMERENEMREVNDRTYAPLVERAADVDFICAPSRMSILTAAALEGIRRYSDKYEFGCLTGGQPGGRTPKFG